MMDVPLLTSMIVKHAVAWHGDVEVVTHRVEGDMHRYTYADAYRRMCRLANALRRLGIRQGERVGTMAWTTYRHFELYFAVGGSGAVIHTVNPRLFHEQIVYIVNHAQDRVMFLDTTWVKMMEKLQDQCPTVERFIILCDSGHMPETTLRNAVCYEDLLDAEDETFDWPRMDEKSAAALCYTSGTTGNPKGVLYTHRAMVLHSMAACSGDHPLGLDSRTVILPAVSMFHVHAWGAPYAAPMCGAKLVLPGPHMHGDNIYRLLEEEKVTLTAGVPTIWLDMLTHMKKTGGRLNHLKIMNIGGSAPPLSMIKAFEEDYGVPVVHAWGMTELSPVGTTGRLRLRHQNLPREERYRVKQTQGRPIFGVEVKIVDDDGNRLPHDGEAVGQMFVRGPWVAAAYFEDEGATRAAFDKDGWFGTGDVASISPDGLVRISDRSKDLIKSGGEWISSIDLENYALAHPGVAEAAAIAIKHPKWEERPLLVVVPRPGAKVTADGIRAVLAEHVAKWWLPDDIVFVEDIPHTATGKISKKDLRARFQDYRWPEAAGFVE
ncbi:MAG: long-chain fatty acid--CoA ligase [Rhodospirillales bacterium CG15_BIG_FIL_POST_REV_8_21_14_020_66_15]|nr:MAG: long-chain fatty acid--CoA ligase [Rhodospirillales bacterium CG15_BIG_FIL_POST_REV_8_21_14_020_66_15]